MTTRPLQLLHDGDTISIVVAGQNVATLTMQSSRVLTGVSRRDTEIVYDRHDATPPAIRERDHDATAQISAERRIAPGPVVSAVEQVLGVPRERFLDKPKPRVAECVLARGLCAYVMRRRCGMSYPEIAVFLTGSTSHATWIGLDKRLADGKLDGTAYAFGHMTGTGLAERVSKLATSQIAENNVVAFDEGDGR